MGGSLADSRNRAASRTLYVGPKILVHVNQFDRSVRLVSSVATPNVYVHVVLCTYVNVRTPDNCRISITRTFLLSWFHPRRMVRQLPREQQLKCDNYQE
jgi:hypothetical protein